MNAWPYFKQHFRSSLKTIIIITALCLMLCMLFTATFQVQKHVGIETGEVSYTYHPTLGMSVFVLCVMSILAPILQFSTFKRRRDLDMWGALPIKRRALGAVHFMIGLLMVIIPFTACFLQNIALLYINGAASNLYMPPLIPFYFLGLLSGFTMYSVNTFIFNRANSIVDGIICMALWMVLIPTLMLCGSAVFESMDMLKMTLSTPTFSPIISITSATEVTMRGVGRIDLAKYFANISSPEGIGFIINTVLGVAAAVGNFLLFGKRRVETVQEVSSSFFCYRTLIPVYAISLIMGITGGFGLLAQQGDSSSGVAIIEFIIGFLFGYTFTSFVAVVAFVGYIIYRRGFHFKRSDGIIMGIIGFLATFAPMMI
ncbi:MAG: hypothetical protein IKK58_01290 [Clostridia bacterium]|nr:hypothetical protein [Clostridia bacterium]